MVNKVIKKQINKSSTGKVYLIGAGPGDVELLTLKAINRLKLADCVLVDDLVNAEILQFANPDAEIIYVGKRHGQLSTPQALIEQTLITLAQAGKQVARLKGGDPFIFGRGGEELEALLNAGIEVEVISGITSGIAVPASIGIPLSHRDYASGITFISGHSCKDNQIDWQALTNNKMTIVIYMGMSNLNEIVQQLINHGMAKETPAAVIQNGTLPTQRSVVASIIRLPEVVSNLSLDSPAIIVIGEVARFANNAMLNETMAI